MDIASLLSPSLVLCQHTSSSKKRILEEIAQHLGQTYPKMSENSIFSSLISREKLGSTGIGNGIAIPHCRISDCEETIAMLITLDTGIDFDAIDGEAVDVIFVLLVPEGANENHLKLLAQIAETFSNEEVLENVRQAQSRDDLLKILA